MSVPFADHADLQTHEIQNAIVQNLASDPGSPAEGQIWWRSDLNQLSWYDGTSVQRARTMASITSSDITDGTIVNADIAAAAAIARSKLDFGSGLVNADIASGAAIAYSKLSLTNSLVVGDLTQGVWTTVHGVGTIGARPAAAAGNNGYLYFATDQDGGTLYRSNGSSWVQLSRGLSALITSSDITDGTIVNADISGSAAIARSKLDFGSGLVNADIAAAAAIARSKLDFGSGLTNSDIASGAAIALSKLATDPLARANHTGTQLASTISNFDTQVRTSRLDQMATPTASVAMGNQKITGLADGTASTDAASWGQVQTLVQGVRFLGARVATTANITLSGTQTIDGIAVVAGDYVLVKNQSTTSQNGLYVVAAGAWSRAPEMDTAAEVDGRAVLVDDGAQAGSLWVSTTDVTTLGTDPVVFSQFNKASDIVDGSGLSFSGLTLSVNVDNSTIEISSDSLRLKDGGVTSAKIADGTITGTDIASGTITSGNIQDGTIATGDIADGQITSAKILDGTIATGDIADGAVTSQKIADGTITDTDVAAANKDGAAGTASMRTLGRGAAQALPGTAVAVAATGKLAQYDASGNLVGVDAPVMGVGPAVGTMYEWAGDQAPPGFLLCDGTAVSRASYADLFSAITLQVVGSTTNANNQITGVNAGTVTRIAASLIGSVISFPNVPNGTTITAASGTTVTLSANATATASTQTGYVMPWGQGDNSTTFNVPDMRGRGAVGLGTHADVNRLGENEGNSVANRSPKHAHTHAITLSHSLTASSGGAHTHSISDPTHSHSINGVGDHSHALGGGATGLTTSGAWANYGSGASVTGTFTSTNNAGSHSHSMNAASTGVSVQSDGAHTHSVTGTVTDSGGTVGASGSSTDTAPYATVQYIIQAVAAPAGGGGGNALKYAGVIPGNGSTTTFTINHALNTSDVSSVIVRRMSDNLAMLVGWAVVDNNNVSITISPAPGASTHRVVVAA